MRHVMIMCEFIIFEREKERVNYDLYVQVWKNSMISFNYFRSICIGLLNIYLLSKYH